MFCIAAFIVFAILGIFSASYRDLAKKAWHCVLRRISFRPCDINFSEEVKGRLLGKLVLHHPRLTRILDRWIDWLALIFVILSVWSLLYVANAGLNLWVYDTCNPSNAESCSLSGEACGIDQASLGLREAIESGRLGEWITGPFTRFAETVSRIPDRIKHWNAQEYLGPTATFFHPENPAKPYALEIIDPSCKFCKKLTGNLKAADVFSSYNVSYLLYPIPKAGTGGYKFVNSFLMASYIEATKNVPLKRGDLSTPPDWQLLEKIFSLDENGGDPDLQEKFVMGYTREAAEQTLRSLLSMIGYTQEDIEKISQLAKSQEIKDSLATQRTIVEEKIRTIKIPTLLFDGRRFDRVVSIETLR
jgi:hypothetical protein